MTHRDLLTLTRPRRIETPIARLTGETLAEFGVTPLMTIAGHLEDARRELSEARDVARSSDEGWLDGRLNSLNGEIDALREVLSEREAEDD